MIRFENDSIDESEAMKDVIQEGKTLLRMKVGLDALVYPVAAWSSSPNDDSPLNSQNATHSGLS